jgi:uncharacterized membrane protein YciS (DUF1049 family)
LTAPPAPALGAKYEFISGNIAAVVPAITDGSNILTRNHTTVHVKLSPTIFKIANIEHVWNIGCFNCSGFFIRVKIQNDKTERAILKLKNLHGKQFLTATERESSIPLYE